MTLGERIKKARRALDLTQQKFADQIGTTQNSIASYEIGRREPSAAAINNICKTFNVNEHWLRTGEGGDAAMFVEAPSDTLDALAKEYGLDRFGRAVIEKMVNLNENQWELLSDMVTGIASSLSEDTALASAPAPVDAQDEAKALEVARIAYEQYLYEKRPGAASSDSSGDTGSGEEMA